MINEKATSKTRGTVKIRGVSISATIYLVYSAYCVSGYSSRIHNYVIVTFFALWTFFAIMEDINAFNKAINNQTFLWSVLFLTYYFFMSIVNGSIINTLDYIAKYILLFSCVLQFNYYRSKNNPKELKFIVVGVLTAWAFFAIKAIVFYITVPSAARVLASDFYAFDNIAIGGGYAIAFGSAILCVFFFEMYINEKNMKKSLKLIIMAFVIVLFYLLIKTESTLTIIGCAIGLVTSIIRKVWRVSGRSASLKKMLTTILLISVSLWVVMNIQEIGEWIIEITKSGTDNTILRRLNRVGQKMAYSSTGSTYTNYVDERWGCVVQSWNTFLHNSIIGVGFKSGNIFANLKINGVGMHSAICDLLAQHGILGAVPCIMFFIKALRTECRVNYNTYIITILFMIIVNPFEYFHTYIAMFTLIPMIECLMNLSDVATSGVHIFNKDTINNEW